MKNKLVFSLLIIAFATTSHAQQNSLKIGYGAGLGLPQGRYIHQLFIEKPITQIAKWSIIAEMSYFHNPKYWFTTKSNDPIPDIGTPVVTDPSEFKLLGLGLKAGRTIYQNDRFQFHAQAGLMMAYGLIEREERITEPGVATSTSPVFRTTAFINEDRGLKFVVPVQLALTRSFQKFGISLIPTYYFVWRTRGVTGLVLSLNI